MSVFSDSNTCSKDSISVADKCINCKEISNNIYCNGFKICKLISSDSTQCFCSPGFEGEKCDTSKILVFIMCFLISKKFLNFKDVRKDIMDTIATNNVVNVTKKFATHQLDVAFKDVWIILMEIFVITVNI